MISENLSLHLASDIRAAGLQNHGKSVDIVITIRMRPGAPAEAAMRVVKKRRSRRKEAPDPRQLDLLKA